MTRLPIESRLAVDRPDLPEYELNEFCPITGESWGLENHHIFRRSAGYPSWWVELPDGEVIGNRVRLSQSAHEKVTTNKARILYANGVYYWSENDAEKTAMRWQPPTMHRSKHSWPGMNPAGLQEDEETAEWLNAPMGPYIEPGHDCPTCNRRVPLPKKKSSPSTKVFSTRIPVDDAESFDELIESLARHFGVSSKPHHKFWAIHYAAVAALQDETLKDALNG